MAHHEPLRDTMKVATERTILVHVGLPGRWSDPKDPFGEIAALVEAAGAEVVGTISQKLSKPSAKTLIRKGKVQELAAAAKSLSAGLIVFDHDLTPAQIRELERACSVKILDRSELILDIFASRAATLEAKLQVEIAQLQYTYPRLRAMWDHLGQVAGGAPMGIGTRGPGETQLEIDRRLARGRLAQLRRELAEVQRRKSREVADRTEDHFTVGLVGYTNAGKSTLFNRLTDGGAFVADMLFATLSTRVDAWPLGGGVKVLVSDTVGFVRDLPHRLVASFRATLEETIHSSLILQVLDASDPHALMQLETTDRTLDEIGATTQPRLVLLNKMDLISPSDRLLWMHRCPEALPISAVDGMGLDELADRVRTLALGGIQEVKVTLPYSSAKAIDHLERRAEVLDRQYGDGTVTLTVNLARRQADELASLDRQALINGVPASEAGVSVWGEVKISPKPGIPPHKRSLEGLK
ncbi:MAG: GTPase HflX [Phycisphaerae bacterium]|nr:GTPase HflX [Phycisphaerae bacterium]